MAAPGTHTITNIEGFEAYVNGNLNDQEWFKQDFYGADDDGRTSATWSNSAKRTGDGNLLVWTDGYATIPLAFSNDGTALQNPITFKAVVARVYVTLAFVAPNATKQVIGLGKDPTVASPPPTPTTRIEVDTSSQLSMAGSKAASPTTLTLNTAYRIEVVYDTVNGVRELWIDGVLELQQSATLQTVDYIMLGDERTGGLTYRAYDDILIEAHRTNPAVVNLPGAGRVIRLDPNGVGTDDDWSASGFGAANWQQVDDFLGSDDDSTYSDNGGAAGDLTVNLEAFSGHAGPPSVPSDNEPRAVKVNNRCKNQSGSPDWVYARVISGATTTELNSSSTGTGSYQTNGSMVLQNDPDTGVAWTRSAVDAMESGLGINNTATGRCTAIQTQVEYSEPEDVFQPQASLVILPN